MDVIKAIIVYYQFGFFQFRICSVSVRSNDIYDKLEVCFLSCRGELKVDV